MTGQCNRRKLYTSYKSNPGDRTFWTRQTRRELLSEAKRGSMVSFAMAQNIYQNEVLKDDAATTKGKKFYSSKAMEERKEDLTRVSRFLAKAEYQPTSERDLDLTGFYMNKLSD
jgi:glutaminase